jgi:hypothetical protein
MIQPDPTQAWSLAVANSDRIRRSSAEFKNWIVFNDHHDHTSNSPETSALQNANNVARFVCHIRDSHRSVKIWPRWQAGRQVQPPYRYPPTIIIWSQDRYEGDYSIETTIFTCQ